MLQVQSDCQLPRREPGNMPALQKRDITFRFWISQDLFPPRQHPIQRLPIFWKSQTVYEKLEDKGSRYRNLAAQVNKKKIK